MKQFLKHYVMAGATALSLLLSGCLEQEFTSSAGHLLTFSSDTLRFDTIFTTIGTATRTLKLYNRNEKALRISSVTLADSPRSGFFMNLDGVAGDKFSNLELAAGDSLFLFVGANINPQDADSPIHIKDSILFVTNGVQQNIKLSAYGRDVVIFRGNTLTSDTLLTSCRPYLIYDSLVVAPNTTLELEAGASLHFHSGASLLVHGTLQANGTLQAPVTLRGDRLDRLFENLPYDFLNGQWEGVRFFSESYNNELHYTSMRGSSWGIVIDSTAITQPKLTVANSVLHNASKNLLTATQAQLTLYNSQLSNAGGALLSLTGGDISVTHCTLANFFKFDIIQSPLVVLTNFREEGDVTIDHPLLRANFYSSIIYGAYTDLAIRPKEERASEFNYLFDHCLLKSNGEDDDQFIATLWATDPLFRNTGEEYLFDFRLDSISPARQAGSAAWTLPPTDVDMLGNSRLLHDAPDVGAFQWVENEE